MKALAIISFLLFAVNAYTAEYTCELSADEAVYIDTDKFIVKHRMGWGRPIPVEIEKVHSVRGSLEDEIFVVDGYLPVETFNNGMRVYFQRYILREVVGYKVALQIDNLEDDDYVMNGGVICSEGIH